MALESCMQGGSTDQVNAAEALQDGVGDAQSPTPEVAVVHCGAAKLSRRHRDDPICVALWGGRSHVPSATSGVSNEDLHGGGGGGGGALGGHQTTHDTVIAVGCGDKISYRSMSVGHALATSQDTGANTDTDVSTAAASASEWIVASLRPSDRVCVLAFSSTSHPDVALVLACGTCRSGVRVLMASPPESTGSAGLKLSHAASVSVAYGRVVCMLWAPDGRFVSWSCPCSLLERPQTHLTRISLSL